MIKLIHFFKKDFLFTGSFIIAIISCFFGTPSIKSIDFKVIFCLFALMLLLKNIENLGVLAYLSEKLIARSTTARQLIQIITFLSFISSMFVTNDVAILTFMPIYLTTVKKIDLPKKEIGAVLLIIAANLGSAFFPFGNPQNLFLFSYYSLTIKTFFSWSLLLLLSSFVLLFLTCYLIPSTKTRLLEQKKQQLDQNRVLFLIFIGILVLASIVDFIPYWLIVPFATLVLFFYDSSTILKVDYRLLGTFVFFFIAVGNFSQFEPLARMIYQQFTSEIHTFFGSIFISQFISNVPAAILIAPFTTHVKALFLGVNIGGLGTLIASLANLIGYKIYKSYYPTETKPFIWNFTWINFTLLLIFITIFYFILFQ